MDMSDLLALAEPPATTRRPRARLQRPGGLLPQGLFGGAFAGKRVLLTGHTGFKGSWLALWLQALGAEVHGLALAPATRPSHWDLLRLGLPEHRVDLRDAAAVQAAVQQAQPQLVLHLAAQPLVRAGYADPLGTWGSNVMGTAHLLQALRGVAGLQAVLVVTTDKCYENREWAWGYRETDALGGHDPYAASKAACELVVASFRASFFQAPGAPLIATARAGNVIGGGDWSADRLVPDIARAVAAGLPLVLRAPQATRPWQHVLESLSGYLLLAQGLLAGRSELARAFNFGPPAEGNRSVAEVLDGLKRHWPALHWALDARGGPHEATLLQLDSSLARSLLGWRPVWDFDTTLRHTADWYRQQQAGPRATPASATQLQAYVRAAAHAGLAWAHA